MAHERDIDLVRVTAMVPDPLFRRMLARAEVEDRSLASVIRLALEAYLPERSPLAPVEH